MSRRLYCEGCIEPVGIDKSRPELSWQMDGEYAAQVSWQVQVWCGDEHIYDSGKQEGKGRLCKVETELKPHSSYRWVLDWELEDGSCGSQSAEFRTGMLSMDQWQGSYITGGTLLRKAFVGKKEIKQAILYFTGLGYCEAYLNGEKITDRVLFPSYTVYEKTVEYTAADVTEEIRQGENVVGLMLGNHWPMDEELRAKDVYSPAFYRGRCVGLAQLNLVYEDGSEEVVATDTSWEASTAPVVCSSVFDGETYDARLEQEGWCKPGAGVNAEQIPCEAGTDSEQKACEAGADSEQKACEAGAKAEPCGTLKWKPAVLAKELLGKLRYSYTPAIRVVETMPVKRIWKKGESWILDFGQNFTGWLRLKVEEPAGTEIVFRHAELLYDDDTLNVENLRAAKAADTYISNGKPSVYEPRFTYHGFRYAEITGISKELTADMVCGRRVHTDAEEIAEFHCSDEGLNRIYDCMRWTIRSNMHSVPTDCCQRDERQGWMADAGVSSEFAIMNFDLQNFYRKWFQDIRDTQNQDDGSMPLAGAPGWPRETFIWKIGYHMCLRSLYLYTGDTEIVRENYPALQRYEAYLHSTLVNGLLDYDFYNDWLAIEFANNLMIANSFLADFYNAMVLFAESLDDADGAELYRQRGAALKDAINQKYYGKCLDNPLGTGYYGTCDTMAVAPSAMALQFGIAREEHKDKIIREMLWQIVESRGSVQYPTGILTSGILNQCLSDLGRDDIAYEFFQREDYPSLRFMLSRGATTIWERWQYLVHNEMNSHNHPAMCSLGIWFFKALLGLRSVCPEKDGGASITLMPYVPEDMNEAKGAIKTVWGTIAMEWKNAAEGTVYTVTVPGNVKAVLVQKDKEVQLHGGVHTVLL